MHSVLFFCIIGTLFAYSNAFDLFTSGQGLTIELSLQPRLHVYDSLTVIGCIFIFEITADMGVGQKKGHRGNGKLLGNAGFRFEITEYFGLRFPMGRDPP